MARPLATVAAIVLALGARCAFASPELYRFDPVHTQIVFSANHEHFSNPRGRLRIKDGWFAFDADDWSRSRCFVEIDMASVDMGDAQWSDTVRSGQFLDVARWPTARFQSRSVEKHGAANGVIHGDLTLHGATHPVDVEFTLNRIGTDPYLFRTKAGFSAQATFDRFDFGMKRYADVVGHTIRLSLEIEGIRDDAAAKNQNGKEKKSDGT